MLGRRCDTEWELNQAPTSLTCSGKPMYGSCASRRLMKQKTGWFGWIPPSHSASHRSTQGATRALALSEPVLSDEIARTVASAAKGYDSIPVRAAFLMLQERRPFGLDDVEFDDPEGPLEVH